MKETDLEDQDDKPVVHPPETIDEIPAIGDIPGIKIIIQPREKKQKLKKALQWIVLIAAFLAAVAGAPRTLAIVAEYFLPVIEGCVPNTNASDIEPRQRIQIDVSPAALRTIDAIKEKTDAASRAEVFRNAIARLNRFSSR